MSMNHVALIGKLISDAECKMTKSDKALCTFSLGVPRDFKKQGAKYAEQDMIACRVWGDIAERLSRYTSKGDWLAVQGRIVIDRYEANGERKTFTYVLCEKVDFVRARGANWSSGIIDKEGGNKNTGNTFDEFASEPVNVNVDGINW